MLISNPDGSKSPIKQEEATVSKKILGIHDSPMVGNKGHLSYIKDKAAQWVTRMTNSHLPSHSAWAAYKHQLWLGLQYRLGTMTNNIEPVEKLLDSTDYKTLNVLGIMQNVTKGLQKLHTTFRGFGLFDLPMEQLVSQINMIFQHYHVPMNLSKKLNASLTYFQLQLGTLHNPFMLNYTTWGELAPLLWPKMLWKLLHKFDITLYMAYPSIPFPQERDEVMMEITFSYNLPPDIIKSINRYRDAIEVPFLSNITTADGKYFKHFIFDPGKKMSQLHYKFPQEQPNIEDWDHWINFWHGFTNTGGS